MADEDGDLLSTSADQTSQSKPNESDTYQLEPNTSAVSTSEQVIETEDQSSKDTKSTKRIEIKQRADELIQTLENCSILHNSLLSDLSLQRELSYDNLESLRKQLLESKANVIEKHKQWRSTCGDLEPDLKIRNKMDRVEADSEQLINQVLEQMNNLPVRNKTTTLNPNASAEPSQIAETMSHTPVPVMRSVRSRSISSMSGSTRASSRIRLMQLEAKANAAALKKKLEASKTTQVLEQQAQKLSMAIEQSKIQAELDAVEAQEQVISQAMEEDVVSLFHPPSQSDQVPNSPSYEPASPAPQSITRPQIAPLSSSHLSADIPELAEPQARFPRQMSAPQAPYLTPDNSTQRPTQGPIAASPVNISSSNSEQQAFATTLAQAIHTIKLKPAEPTIFSGDPLTYLDWKVAFEGLIESGSYTSLQKLALLQQYLEGKAKNAVSSLFQIGTEEAFHEAKKKLDKRFGQPHVLSEAYLFQLEQWPLINEHDGESLEELVDFLESCKTAMKVLPELHCLNDRRENAKILEKLPLSVGNRWVQLATQIEASTMKFPSIHQFCEFLSKEASVARNSLNKALAKRAISNRSSNTKQSKLQKQEQRVNALFATENSPKEKYQPRRVKYPCMHCNLDNHTTGVCFKLSKLSHTDIEKFFVDNNLCFSCSKPNHKMNECRHPEHCTMKDCGQQHLTVFHDYYNRGSKIKSSSTPSQTKFDESRGGESKTAQPMTSVPLASDNAKHEFQSNNPTATARSCTDISTRPANLTSWTIPIYVSTIENPGKEVLVYALLDSGSNNTFITTDTLNKLNAKTTKQDVNISTLTDADGCKSTRGHAAGLLVRGYRKQKIIPLPLCINQNKIPYNQEEIPNSLSVQDWPHLRDIAPELISEQDSKTVDLGLLIGANFPQVFISREECVRADHEPFARLTDLGWILMGRTITQEIPTEKWIASCRTTIVTNRTVNAPINREHVAFKIKPDESLERTILQLFSTDFQSTPSENRQTLSVDDLQFLKIMNKQIHKDKEGYMTMPLTLKHKPGINK